MKFLFVTSAFWQACSSGLPLVIELTHRPTQTYQRPTASILLVKLMSTMKTALLVALTACWSIRVALAQPVGTNEAIEKEIRQREQGQVEYALHTAYEAMEKQWSPDYVVNNPFNQVVQAKQGPMRKGELAYSTFTRDIEKVLIQGPTVIVMGAETVVPTGTTANAGKTIRRRFTNVWMNTMGNWLLVARHANVICQP